MYLGQHFREVGDGWKVFCCGWKIFDCGWKIGWKIFRSQVCLPAFIVFTVRVLRRFWDIWQIFSRAELLCVAASFPSGHLSAFIITPPLALAIATMSTANVFGLFLLAPITDVLSHRCLGATPGSLVLSELLKSILFSLVSYFGSPEPARIVVLSMSNSIILGAMYLFFLMVLFIVVCISDLVLVCLCMQN